MATDEDICTKCLRALSQRRPLTKGCAICMQLRNAQASKDLVDNIYAQYRMWSDNTANGQGTSEGCHYCDKVNKLVTGKYMNCQDQHRWRRALQEYCARCELEHVLEWAKDDFNTYGLANKYPELWDRYLGDPIAFRRMQLAHAVFTDRPTPQQTTSATTEMPGTEEADVAAAFKGFATRLDDLTTTVETLASAHLRSMTSSRASTKLYQSSFPKS